MDALVLFLIAIALSLLVILFHNQLARPKNFPPGE